MKTARFTLADGTELAGYSWLPPGEPRVHVYLLHGFGEYSGRYTELADRLTSAGHALHSVDHRGHGRSQGRRALVQGPEQVSRDYREFLAAEPQDRTPRVLLGHSMGGAAAAQLALREISLFSGLVLSSPYLVPARPPSGILLAALGLISRLAPGLVVEKLASSDLSRQPEEARAYDTDPLVHSGGVPARTAHSLLTSGRLVLDEAKNLRLPLLVLHGGRDAIAGVAGSRQLLEAAGSADKELVEFPEARHEVMNDLDRDAFFTRLLAWLERF